MTEGTVLFDTFYEMSQNNMLRRSHSGVSGETLLFDTFYEMSQINMLRRAHSGMVQIETSHPGYSTYLQVIRKRFNDLKKAIKEVFVRTLPVLSGYMVLGIGFGVIAQKNGYGILWVLAMSLFIYAGSMQYVAVSLLTSGGSLVTAILTTLMVNARHLFYGISMVDRYKGAGRKKPYMIFALTDETYSLVCDGKAPEGCDYHTYCFLTSLFDHCYWVCGSLVGAAVGAAIPFDFAGVEFAMTALFLTVFVEQWITASDHIPAMSGVLISVISLLIFGRDRFLIPAMIGISIALIAGRKRIEQKQGTIPGEARGQDAERERRD